MVAALTIDPKEWNHIALAYGDLGAGKVETGIRRGINQAGNKARTPAIRATAAHSDAPQKMVRQNLVTYPARGSSLTYRVRVKSKTIKLVDMGGARNSGAGARVNRWGFHRGAFVQTMPSGHRGVFTRTGGMNSVSGRNNAIKELYGPNVAKSFDKKGAPIFVEKAGELLVPFIYKRLDGVVAQAGRRRGVLR